MKIKWNQNPLWTEVEVDEHDKQIMSLKLKLEELRWVIVSALSELRPYKIKGQPDRQPDLEKAIKELTKHYNDDEDEDDRADLENHVSYLSGTHGGDCTCWPASCPKCMYEELLGINTIEGLGKHSAAKIMNAFGHDGTVTIEEAIKKLENYSPKRDGSWLNWPLSDFTKHLPRWNSEAKDALEWLKKYRDEHFPQS